MQFVENELHQKQLQFPSFIISIFVRSFHSCNSNPLNDRSSIKLSLTDQCELDMFINVCLTGWGKYKRRDVPYISTLLSKN